MSTLVQIAIACAVAGFFAGCQVQGWRLGQEIAQIERDASRAAQQALHNAREAEQAQQALSDAVAEAAALRDQKREVVEKVVTEVVIRYVQKPVAAECGLDPDGVRIHNIAAAGRVPDNTETTAQPYAPAKRATAASVVQTVAGNYATCHETSDRLVSLQEWVRGVLGNG